MADNKAIITEHQPSLTEWFAAIGEIAESEAFREEDNRKADRLEVLYQTIGVPYERPEEFSARDLTDLTPAFAKILAERGDELCAIRLIPTKPNLPKLRIRGLNIREAYESWFLKQKIDPDVYVAHVCPHSEILLWSAIFVINEQGIFGEIIPGMHNQLTQGETINALRQWRFDFKEGQWSVSDEAAAREVTRMVASLYVPDKAKQKHLAQSLGAAFSHDYLCGYFEATVWPGDKMHIIDYNRVLSHYIPTPPPFFKAVANSKNTTLHGTAAERGQARGRVVIVNEENIGNVNFPEGSILVCDNTDVRYLPLMRRAAAIVTNRGGILSHAAIIARELKKPCIIGTNTATKILKNGDQVKVDADHGTVTLL